MITTLPFLSKKHQFGFLFFLLFSASVFGQVTVTSFSPIKASYKSVITINGTNFPASPTVQIGGVTATSVTRVSSTQITAIPAQTVSASNLQVTVDAIAAPGRLEFMAPQATPANASVSRVMTNFNTYWSSTTTSTLATEQPDTRHEMLAFEFANVTGGGKTIYSTGVNDALLTPGRVTSFTAGDFRALPIDIIGRTSTNDDNFIIYGDKIDGNPNGPNYLAAAGVHVRDVLMDGIKGLDLGTGVTNINPSAIFEFEIARIADDKLSDNEPDIIITQIADPSTGTQDVYYFTDALGNIVGRPLNANLGGITAIGTYKVDLFTLTQNSSYETVRPSANGAPASSTRDIRMIGFRLSDFGINPSNYNSITKFKIFPGGNSDAAFTAYNANSIFIPAPAITSQPASFAGCPTASPNGNATFTVVAKGGGKYYQWKKDGVDIPGATSASYTITGVTDAHVGAYTVEVRNVAGSVLSDPSYLGNYWTGAIDNDWNKPGNWNCGLVPSTTLSANIPNLSVATPKYPVLSAGSTGTCLNLNIGSAARVDVTGTGVLQIAGAINKNGTLDAVDGTVRMIGTTGAQSIPANTFAANKIKNLTINNTNGVTLAGALDLTGILTSTAGTFTTGNQLTLKSNVNTTAMIAPVTGVIAGRMTVERYIPARRAYRFLSSSVDGYDNPATAGVNEGSILYNWQENAPAIDPIGFGTDITGASPATNGFDASFSNNPSMFTYANNNLQSTSSWIAVPNTNVTRLMAGVPYRIMVRGDRTVDQHENDSPASITTLRAHGNIKTGDVVISNLTTTAGRQVFVGNPYQAPVDMAQVLSNSTGFATGFYQIWDPQLATRGAYANVNVNTNTNGQGSVATKFVQPGQAFFVQANAASQTMTFKESYKTLATATTTVFRNQSPSLAKIGIKLYENDMLAQNGPALDGFEVAFEPSLSNSIDDNDAIKMGNLDENAGIMNAGKVLIYESRSLPTVSDVIPLFNNQYRSTNYTYKATVSGLEGITAYLVDKATNSRTELVNGSETNVSFSVNASDAATTASNRFDIIFESSALGNEENAFSAAVRIYPNPIVDNQFFIQLPAQIGSALKVKVVTLLGQEVFAQSVEAIQGTAKIQPALPLQSGIYLINLTDGTNTATKKLIVK